jgi:5'-3' exonuclease
VRLHLLDGTYELFRSYFGAPSRTAPDGREVGATVGVMESTLSLLREPDVTHLGVAFDTVIESFRNDLFDGYKTGAGIEPELFDQFPLVERAVEALGVVVWRMRDFEADDAIATAAARWSDEVEQVIILSPDKDLAQCVETDRVVTFNRRERRRFDAKAVEEKFGVRPGSIPDYLALVGDSADGVPGLPGWGAKSAGAVLGRYDHLERIPSDPGAWDVTVRGAARLSETLEASRADAELYRTLTTLRRDVPLEETLDDLRWTGVPREAFLEMCDELGVGDLRERPHRWAGE